MGIEFTSESTCSECDDNMSEGNLCFCEECWDERKENIDKQEERIEELEDNLEESRQQLNNIDKSSILKVLETMQAKISDIKLEINKRIPKIKKSLLNV